MGEFTHAGNPASNARSYQHDSPPECERCRWLTSTRRRPDQAERMYDFSGNENTITAANALPRIFNHLRRL
jgi:hypothetical protein